MAAQEWPAQFDKSNSQKAFNTENWGSKKIRRPYWLVLGQYHQIILQYLRILVNFKVKLLGFLLQLFLAKYFEEVGVCTKLGPMNVYHCLSNLHSAFWVGPISRAYCALLDKHGPTWYDSHSRGLFQAPTRDSQTSPWSLSLRSASKENKVYYFRVCFVPVNP